MIACNFPNCPGRGASKQPYKNASIISCVLLIPFLKNNDCLEFLNCPARGAHALRPYKNASIIYCILLRKWYKEMV
jgi:hypothetical protein